jgi:hypothetical protein
MASLHGFERFIDYIKASIAIGAPICIATWTMLTWALDDRYAPLAVQEAIKINGSLAKSVSTQIQGVKEQIAQLEASAIQDRIFDARVRGCSASSSESRRFFAQRVSSLSDKYSEIQGRRPVIPSCEDVQ